MWYTKPEGVRRFTIWACGTGLGQIIGGLVSWVKQIPLVLMTLSQIQRLSQGFQKVTGESLAGWRIMFVVLGILTIVVGLLTIIAMPDHPMSANWLSDAEKTVAIQRVAVNQTGIQNKHFKWSQLKELGLDVQIWLLAALTMLVCLQPSISSWYHILSSPVCVIAALDLYRDNHNLLRNYYPQFWIFLLAVCAP
jgi:MFS family permease